MSPVGIAGLALALAAPARATEVDLGTYGRAYVGGDLNGGESDPVDVVSRPTRLEKGPYAEVDLIFREEGAGDLKWRAVLTPAITGDLFHTTGEWTADLALRNLFAEARGRAAGGRWTAWAGSRIWRGDDVYLFDFWPLDNLNVVGAGGGAGSGTFWIDGLVGANKITGLDYQTQSVGVVTPGSVAEREVEVLDRQRRIAALKAGGMLSRGEGVALRLQGYVELQTLPEGERLVGAERVPEALPADRGVVAGMQLSAWGWADGSFAHLWYRCGTGLATIGELAVPTTGFAADRTLGAAREHLVAAAANHDAGRVSVLLGAWARGYRDADGVEADWDDRVEAAAALRPTLWITEWAGLGAELSHQRFTSPGVDPASQLPGAPAVTRLALMPTIQAHPGSMGRPQLRLQYIYSHQNDDARWRYPEEDRRFATNHLHSVGAAVEWWLNSASYRPGGIP